MHTSFNIERLSKLAEKYVQFILPDVKLTGTKGGGSNSDRNHLHPSAAPG